MIEEKSLDIFAEKMAKLRELFPEVLSEGKIDFKRLQSVLGDEAFFHKEHYELSWAGKSDARAQIQKATSATLIPDSGINAEESQNVFIEGENLEVLHVLQRAYFGKIKMIYIDPPYNTGNDSFVYPDDYSERQDEYKKRAGITDENGFLNKQDYWKKNSKENGQFHSVWLSMMYPRLYLARNLLREDGVIFISIDDNEQANLKLLCDEIFGVENFVGQMVWKRRQNVDSRAKNGVSTDHEYIICYRKSTDAVIRGADKDMDKYSNPDNDSRGDWMSADMTGLATKDQRPNLHYDLENPKTGIVYQCPPTGWRYEPKRMQQLLENDELIFPNKVDGRPRRKKFLNDLQSEFTGFSTIIKAPFNTQATRELRTLFDEKDYFDFPKPEELIKQFIQQGTEKESLILDFFAGSGTTAHAVLDLNEQDGGNRQFICVQMPEVLDETSEAYKAGYRTIADICKTRITKVIEKIQSERDSQKQTDLIPTESKQVLGFKSFKLAPSNFKQWRSDVDETDILAQLELFKDSEQPQSENDAMLIELLLKAGLLLTTKVEIHTVAEQVIYSVKSSKLLFFFDDYNESVKAFIFTLKPKCVVCLNRVFKNDDQALTNFQLGLKDAGCELQII